MDRDLWHIGSNVQPHISSLPKVTADGEQVKHGNTFLRFGTETDGVSRSTLAAYLGSEAGQHSAGLIRFDDPPTVRLVEDATAGQIDAAVRAIQLINASLPNNWQLRMESTYVSRDAEVPLDDEILIRFAPNAEWQFGEDDACSTTALGCTDSYVFEGTAERAGAHVVIDPTQEYEPHLPGLIVHEVLHALGRHHADSFLYPKSIMVSGGWPNALHALYPLDQDALYAVHDRLDAGDTYAQILTKLGPWEQTATHVVGSIWLDDTLLGMASMVEDFNTERSVYFGAVERNGFAQAWAYGPSAVVDLEHNPSLNGTVTWSGRLLGMTPTARTVAGDVELEVILGPLVGTLRVDDMEMWAADTAPGELGTGTQWGDGDLYYGVKVRGSTFIQETSFAGANDDGIVTGAFFGAFHEGMGGTIRRDDLAAGFGGVLDED